MALGYNRPLYILPFDHRATFAKAVLGINGTPSREDKNKITEYKDLVYEAFKLAIVKGVPKDGAGLLVDEEYGEKIIKEAGKEGYITCLTVEKSGQEEFDFEYGKDFESHIKKINPTFAKVLIRYNPEGDKELNKRQCEKLKILSDFCQKSGYKFLLEALVPPTNENIIDAGGKKHRYDKYKRPELTATMMRELQDAGVEADVWKLEGMWNELDYKKISAVARNSKERTDVGVVILGRGEEKKDVVTWIRNGSHVKGIIGFAVGRTIFLNPLIKYKNKEIDKATVVNEMADKYKYFYDIFVGNR